MVSLSLCVIMCCTVDSCVDVINISPGTLTQTRACEEYRDFVILILHQQWDEAYCLHSLWPLSWKHRVIQLKKIKSHFPAFPFKLCCVMKVTLFSINVMLLWLLGWAASQARAVSDHGGNIRCLVTVEWQPQPPPETPMGVILRCSLGPVSG